MQRFLSFGLSVLAPILGAIASAVLVSSGYMDLMASFIVTWVTR